MPLTSAQIKTILDAIAFSETVVIFGYTQEQNRRKFTNVFVEIENKIPTQDTQDPRITTTKQEFLIHLFVKTIVKGTEEEARLSTLEQQIKSALDAAVLGGTQLFEEIKSWNRIAQRSPLRHTEDILTVTVKDINDTTGSGTVGAEITVTFPSLAAMPILNKPAELETELNENIYDDTRKRVQLGPIGETHQSFYEVEYTAARLAALRTHKTSRAIISVTCTRNGVDEIFNCKLTQLSHGTPRENIETIVIQVDRLN